MLKPCFTADNIEAGVDEVGRGCTAGPVVAAAVILPRKNLPAGINDSKKLSLKKRELISSKIIDSCTSYGVGFVSPKRIDEINILQASIEAMHLAIQNLTIKPELLLIDGIHFNSFDKIPHKCIIKGDSKYTSIAAASIIAKVYRDRLMKNLSADFPGYGWESNVGYPTKMHKNAVNRLGATIHHRASFKLI